MAGRPQTVAANVLNLADHPEIAQLYAHIAELRNHQGWGACHVSTGAAKSGTPVIKVRGKTMRMADFFADVLNLPKGRKQCATPNCFNPYHYLPQDPVPPTVVLNPEEGVKDLLDYIIESQQIPAFMVTFDTLRSRISNLEVTDEQLTRYLTVPELGNTNNGV